MSRVVRDAKKAQEWFENVDHAFGLRHCCDARKKELKSLTKLIRRMFGMRNEVSHFTATDVEKVLNTEKLKEYADLYEVVVESKLCREFDKHGHIQQVWMDITLFSASMFIAVNLQSMATRVWDIAVFYTGPVAE